MDLVGGRGKRSHIREGLSRTEENNLSKARTVLAESPLRAENSRLKPPHLAGVLKKPQGFRHSQSSDRRRFWGILLEFGSKSTGIDEKEVGFA